MKLLDNQLNEPSLSSLGEEACRLLIARDFLGLADKFGYALAYNQDPAAAIKSDFEHCLAGCAASPHEPDSTIVSVTVKNFQPNDIGLLKLVECIVRIGKSARVLVDLIVAKNGENTFLYLEDMNAAD